MIYLDHNASTPVAPQVAAQLTEHLATVFANPASRHAPGREAEAQLEAARAQVAALLGRSPRALVFTSGGTEANNLALKGMVHGMGVRRLLLSPVEHASVIEPARFLARDGAVVLEWLPVDAQGRVSPAALASRLAGGAGPTLVSVMTVNNETGVIQDIPALARVVREAGAWLHTDAVQAAGRLPLAQAVSGAHLVSLSAHKLGGIKGAGALWVDPALDLTPLCHGGGQEGGRRAGTEALPAWVAFAAACALAERERAARQRRWATWRDRFEAALVARLPEVVIHGRGAPRVANTSFFSVPGVDGEALLMALDERGFAVGSGSACGKGRPSHVLEAMGVDEPLARAAVRVSLGADSEWAHLAAFLDALSETVTALRRLSAVATF